MADFDSLQDDSVPAAPPVAAAAPQASPTGPSFDDMTDDADKYGTPGQQIKTAAEGVTRGVLGPLAPGFEQSLGVEPQDILAREKANPITHGLGEVAGLIGGSLTGAGEGALLDVAGEGAVHAAGLGNLAKDASVGSQLGAGAVKAAVEQGLFQGGDEASKMLLNDPDTSAQSALGNVGLAMGVGGLTGAALGSISPLWKAAVGDKAAPILEDMKSRYKFRTENPDLVTSATDELKSKVDAVEDLRSKLYSEDGSGAGLKAEMISKALPEDMDKIYPHIEDIDSKISKTFEKLESDPDSYPPRLTKMLQNDYAKWESATKTADATPEDVFNATQDLKKSLQSYSKFNKDLPRTSPEYDFVNATKDLGHDVRISLEDPKVWGKAANIQQDINAAMSSFLDKNVQKGFTSKFMTNGVSGKEVNPAAVQTYMKQLGKPSAEIKQDFMREYLDRHDELINTVNKLFTDEGLDPQIQHTSTNVLRSTLGEQTTGSKLMDALIDKAAAKFGGNALGASAGATAGFHVGLPGIGALLGEHMLGPMAGSAIQALVKPMLETSASSHGLKSAVDYAINAIKGQNTLGKATKGIFTSGRDVLTSKMLPDQADRDKLDKVVTQMQKQPNKMLDMDNGKLSHYAGNHAVALSQSSAQAVQYLESIKPGPHILGPLDKPVPPQPSEIARYNRALDIAQQPAIIMQHIKDGTLQASDIKDLHNLYPALYKDMSSKISNEMISAHNDGVTIPYKTRMAISLFLGQPVDVTMQPSSIMAAQPMPKADPPQQQQAAQKSKKGTQNLGKSNKSYMTPGQSAESDRSDRS